MIQKNQFQVVSILKPQFRHAYKKMVKPLGKFHTGYYLVRCDNMLMFKFIYRGVAIMARVCFKLMEGGGG